MAINGLITSQDYISLCAECEINRGLQMNKYNVPIAIIVAVRGEDHK